jgi:hypothetical protein
MFRVFWLRGCCVGVDHYQLSQFPLSTTYSSLPDTDKSDFKETFAFSSVQLLIPSLFHVSMHYHHLSFPPLNTLHPPTTPHTFTPCMHASPHPHHVLPHTQRSLHRVPRVKPRSPVNSHNFSTAFTSPLTPLSAEKQQHCIKHPLISHTNPYFTP